MPDDWQCSKCPRKLPDSPDLALAIRIHEKSHEPRPNGPRSSGNSSSNPVERVADSLLDAADAVADFFKGLRD